jgi:hypothetical protein
MATMSDNEAGVLLSEAIMARLERAATDSGRGQRRLETLRRLKIACDDIASGKAVDYAEKAGADSAPFKIRPRRIHSITVGEYIRIRRRLAGGSEGEKLWPGPIESTLRADKDLKSYLEARQTEANGFRNKKYSKSTRAQTVNEIVSAIRGPHDRLLIMTVIEQGREAQRKLRLASAAIPKLWAIDLDAVIAGGATPETSFGNTSELTEQDRSALRKLLVKLTSNAELREFNLIYDHVRVKMRGGTGAALISKDELSLLRSLAQMSP